jgi:hypothetical protein
VPYGTLREKISAEKADRAARYATFAAALADAFDAGERAGADVVPVGMVVSDNSTGQKWVVSDGVCGFGWVTIHPGSCSFARWLVKNGHARKAYGGGVSIWSPLRTQSYARNKAWAVAVASSLRERLGLTVYTGSRLD